jgi:asparagine synthase (glutamine-hydrolysing)
MGEALVHRGPDRSGVWCDLEAGVALAFRRLAIIDLSPQGDQPMVSADGRRVIVFNGEIFNHLELRTELDARHAVERWRGRSDTEVLLEGMGAWGLEGALEHIEGQFAFALWDRAERTLHLARDRFGEKPLYWGWAGADFVFGSELKALRRHPKFDREIDASALAAYVRFGYTPSPTSIYRHVRKLAPGFRLSLSPQAFVSRAPQVSPYWSLAQTADEARAEPFEGDEEAAGEALDALLRETVRSRMISDVPLGALLSGGIDSSLVSALMQAEADRPIKTFTIGSWDRGLNEADHAKAVARALGTEHTELYVGPQEALEVIPQIPGIWDEPFADSSQIPTVLVSRLARRNVTVALSGDGGDELFGGYNRYTWGARLWRRLGGVPRPARAAAARALRALSPEGWSRFAQGLGPLAPHEFRHGRAGEKIHKLSQALSADGEGGFHRALVSLWGDPSEALAVAARETAPDAPALDGAGFAERAMLLDAQAYLPDDILVKVDRASMSTSLETRTPFLDREVFRFAWRLPLAMKIGEGRGKRVLRRVLARYLPQALFERPKQGFAVPISDWLRGELRDWGEALLEETRLKDEGLFDAGVVRQVWSEHQSGRRNWDARLWTLLMFQAWQASENVREAAAHVARSRPASDAA